MNRRKKSHRVNCSILATIGGRNITNITLLFNFVDGYWKIIDENFASRLLPNGKTPSSVPEIMYPDIVTIILLYQKSRYEIILYTLLKAFA